MDNGLKKIIISEEQLFMPYEDGTFLDYLFKNEKVKVIVHINHEYDNNLPY